MNEKKIIFALAAGLLLVSCAATHRDNTWDDAVLVTSQRATIEQQRRTLDDLDAAVSDVRAELESARADLERAIREAADIRSQWAEIDKFVRRVIEAERRLEELQSADRGADAGER